MLNLCGWNMLVDDIALPAGYDIALPADIFGCVAIASYSWKITMKSVAIATFGGFSNSCIHLKKSA